MNYNTFHEKIIEKLQGLRPKAEWSLDGDTYEGIKWLDKHQSKPTKEEIGLWNDSL